MNNEALQEIQKKIEYQFHNENLLITALTHSSYANERITNKVEDYERQEFLGDSILELVSSEFIYKKHTQMPEGEMTKLRASMVCEKALAFSARDLELGRFIRIGKGEERTGGRERESIIADVMEAMIGGIYLDSGLEEARSFIHKFILEDVENKQIFNDNKTLLQEYIQKNGDNKIVYEPVAEEGPEHDKIFIIQVSIDGKVCGIGRGRNKKAAEQNAAYEALLHMKK